MSARSEARAIVSELRAMGSEANRAGMARFSINTKKAFGVSMAAMRPLERRFRRRHELALELWTTGWHEARILAALIDDPKQVTGAQMDSWVSDIDSWDICDQASMRVFGRTPFANAKIKQWAKDEREFVRRAAFATIVGFTLAAKDAGDEVFEPFFKLIEKHSTDDRNFVRKAVNWALRQIGKRSLSLHAPALALAEKLAASDNRSARWIGRDAVRELTDPVQRARIAARSVRR